MADKIQKLSTITVERGDYAMVANTADGAITTASLSYRGAVVIPFVDPVDIIVAKALLQRVQREADGYGATIDYLGCVEHGSRQHGTNPDNGCAGCVREAAMMREAREQRDRAKTQEEPLRVVQTTVGPALDPRDLPRLAGRDEPLKDLADALRDEGSNPT